MRPLLLIGMTALLLCTAGCSNPISKLMDDWNGDAKNLPQQATTQDAAQPSAQSDAQTRAPSQTQAQTSALTPSQTQASAPAPASAPAAPPSPEPRIVVDSLRHEMFLLPPNTHGQIHGTEVRMREGPSTNDVILGYFDNGEYLSLIGSTDGWYYVRRANGSDGWVSADFCKKI